MRTVFSENEKGAIVYKRDGQVYLHAQYRFGLWFAVFPTQVEKGQLPTKYDIADAFAVNAIQEEYCLEGTGDAVLRNKALLLHKALGHPSWRRLKYALKHGLVKCDFKITQRMWSELPRFCDACVRAKQTRARRPKASKKRSTAPFQQLHIDLAECNSSLRGYKYAVIIVDDFTNYNWVLPLKKKGDIQIKTYRLLREICTGKHAESSIFLPSKWSTPAQGPRIIRTDGAGELTGDEFTRMCQSMGTRKLTTVPYSSHQNGRAEKAIRDLFTTARALRIDANLPEKYWWYALQCACHCKNRTPAVRRWYYEQESGILSDSEPLTPFYVMTGRHPDVSYMVPFGCRCFTMKKPPKTKRKSKTAAVSDECKFLGYEPGTKGFIIQPIAHKNTTKGITVAAEN